MGAGRSARQLRRPARPIYFNGKFYCGDLLCGVHRVADRLIREVDRLAAQGWGGHDWDLRLLVPDRFRHRADVSAFRVIGQRWGHTKLWEQTLLPFAARNGVLVNLANLSPVVHGAKVTMMHDAQFYLVGDSYPLYYTLAYRALTPLIASSSRVVLTVSEFSREMLAGFGVADRKRTEIIYNGVDHILDCPADVSILAAHELVPRDYVVMFGSTFAYKNIATVFEAFKRMPAPVPTLVVVGHGKEEILAAGLSPPASAVFVGRISDGALRALYEQALCLLHPSRTEGFGLTPLEAMLCGCPAIVSPAGAIPEICRDAVLYADVSDPQAWVEQVQKLVTTPELRALKIAQGSARAQGFTWARSGERLMSVLMRLSA